MLDLLPKRVKDDNSYAIKAGRKASQIFTFFESDKEENQCLELLPRCHFEEITETI